MAEHTPKVYRVREPFSFDVGQVQYAMRTGQLVGEEHPAMKSGGRMYLEEVTDENVPRQQAVRAVETATAAPGEVRRVRPGGKG